MMRHATLELTALLDGALPDDERARVEAHVAMCAACRAERDRLASALALLAGLPPAPAPSRAFGARLEAQLASAPGGRRGGLLERLRAGLRWQTVAPGLAGIAAAAGVALWVGQRHRSDETFLAEHLELFENFEEVASVGTVESPEDLEVVAHLDELRPAGEARP